VAAVAAGFGLVTESPSQAAGDVPMVTVTGTSICSSGLDGVRDLGWTISQDTDYGGLILGYVASPDTTLNPNTNVLSGKADVLISQLVPYGVGGTTASLTVSIDFSLPGGEQTITATGSVALPHCPRRVAAVATFDDADQYTSTGCVEAATVTVSYPVTAELTATVVVVGYALPPDNRTWSPGTWTMHPGNSRTVIIPAPYYSRIAVTQDNSALVLGQYTLPTHPVACGPSMPVGPLKPPRPIAPPPTGRTSTSTDLGPGILNDPSASSPPMVAGSPTGSTTDASPADATVPALPVLVAASSIGHDPIVLGGLGVLIVAGTGLGIFLAHSRRRTRSSADHRD
jgi:hypothetical protein